MEGLVISYESRLGTFLVVVDRFRVGTPSGHVHCWTAEVSAIVTGSGSLGVDLPLSGREYIVSN